MTRKDEYVKNADDLLHDKVRQRDLEHSKKYPEESLLSLPD